MKDGLEVENLIKGNMKKILATMILSTSISTAYAHGNNSDIATGIIGGMIMGNMIQQYVQPYMQPYMNQPAPPVIIHQPPPVVIHSPCYWVQEPIYDAWGRIVTYRQVRVCRTY